MTSVALESTVFAHGLPAPLNLEVAFELERIVSDHGAEPRTVGVVDGRAIVGLSEEDIRRIATESDVRKVSQRDLPVVLARRLTGATTVAATSWLAHRRGIQVVCTGGLGGVHRGNAFDVSNDLYVLASTPITVVCSGPKAVLDLGATREFLESAGVTVVGFKTSEFPAFYSSTSGFGVDVRCDEIEEVAEIVKARRRIGLMKATVVAVPVPAEFEMTPEEIEPVVEEADAEAALRGIGAADLTPFLLERIASMTGGRSLSANCALLRNNAAVAAGLALAL